jgi:Concanavalin A-like lectin/glucanases superfamily
MKKQSFYLFFLTALLSTFTLTNCTKEPGDDKTTLPTEGLVAYYPFDGNAQDESGYNNHGNPNNGVQFVRNRKDEESKAVFFDGIDDYVKVPHSGAINFGRDQDFTVSLWVKYGNQENTIVGDNDILSKWNGGYPFVVRMNNQTAKPPYGPPGTWYAARWDGSKDGGVHGPDIADQKYHHIVFVKKGTLLFGYTDGVETSRDDDGTINETKNDAPLYIGTRTPSPTSNFFTGAVDDLRIYNRALTEVEIQQLFHEQ